MTERRAVQIVHALLERARGTFRPPKQASAFDSAYYMAQYPDVAAAAYRNPLRHYLNHGWREGRRPNAWFDPAAYRSAYPDVAENDVEPLLHYLCHGRSEGRWAGVEESARTAAEAASAVPPRVTPSGGSPRDSISRVARSGRAAAGAHFDASFYAAANPEVAASGVDLLDHFMERGWREGRNPSRTFDVSHYLEDNPDVAAADLNPLVHYTTAGQAEGRRLRPPLTRKQRQLRDAVPQRVRAVAWAAGADLSPALSRADLDELWEELAAGDDVVVSVSHDQYLASTGGVQQLLAAEQEVLAEAGVHYLHVAPAVPLPMLADNTSPESFRAVVALDGRRLGVVTLQTLLDALAAKREEGVLLDVVVHQLMGHAPEAIVELVSAAGVQQPVVWAHDFFALCTNYALMRNDIEFCGAPPASSPACGVCCYGGERQRHLSRMVEMFESLRPVVLAPSVFALTVWQRAGHVHASAHVQPLARLVEPGTESPPARMTDRPLRVAHLGGTTYLKGWEAFEELALALEGDERYEFLQLGLPGNEVLPGNVRCVPVRVHGGDPQAMVSALEQHQVDVVINWSLAAETFSFTTYEALAAGAFVVVRSGESNVWPAVQQTAPGQGLQLDSTAELTRIFASGGILELVERAPRRRRLLLPTGGSADPLLRRRVHRRNSGARLTT